MKYVCVACKEFTVEMDQDALDKVLNAGFPWLYCYCPKCLHVSHHDDVIANHETHLKQIAAENNPSESIH